jgi:hypothetical protein
MPFVTGLGKKRGKENKREVLWPVVRRIYKILRNTIKAVK